MVPQMIRITAVYEDGVLKPQGGRIPSLTSGDRVEVVLVRVALIDVDAPSEVARREQIQKAFDEEMKAIAALPPDPNTGMTYEEECQAFDERRGGSRKLFPPELRGVTW